MRELIAGGAPRQLSAEKAFDLLNDLAPDDPANEMRLEIAFDHIEDVMRLDRKIDIFGASRADSRECVFGRRLRSWNPLKIPTSAARSRPRNHRPRNASIAKLARSTAKRWLPFFSRT